MLWDTPRLSQVLDGGRGEEDRQADRFALWALWAIESLDYLPPLDESNPRTASGTEVVELARVRWATGTAITSLDLCAAMLGVQHAGFAIKGRAAGLRDFRPKKRPTDAVRRNRAALPPKARAWVDSVWADDEFTRVSSEARNPFTHSTMPRHVKVHIGAPSLQPREFFPIGPNGVEISSTAVVTLASDVAERWVSKFYDGLAAGAFGLTKTTPPPLQRLGIVARCRTCVASWIKP